MKLNKILLFEILESCENHLPTQNGNGLLPRELPKEDFPSLSPYDSEILFFHIKLLINDGYIFTHGQNLLDGLTLAGYKKLEEHRGNQSANWWISS